MNKLGSTTRRAMRVGNSVAVSLPVAFMRTHGIKVGDELRLIFNHSLVIKPVKPLDLESEIEQSLVALKGGGDAEVTPSGRKQPEADRGASDAP